MIPPRKRNAVALAATIVLALVTTAACGSSVKPGTGRPRVMLVGDSIAHNLADALTTEFAAHGRAFDNVAVPGCGVVRGVIASYPAHAPLPWAEACDATIWGEHQARVERFRPDVVIWFSQVEAFPRFVDGALFAPFESPAGDAKLLQLIEEKRQQLTRLGAKLVFVLMPPPITDNGLDERVEHMNALFVQYSAQHPDTGVFDLVGQACPGGRPCPAVVDGVELRPDGFHFSADGARWVASRLVPSLLDAFQSV